MDEWGGRWEVVEIKCAGYGIHICDRVVILDNGLLRLCYLDNGRPPECSILYRKASATSKPDLRPEWWAPFPFFLRVILFHTYSMCTLGPMGPWG